MEHEFSPFRRYNSLHLPSVLILRTRVTTDAVFSRDQSKIRESTGRYIYIYGECVSWECAKGERIGKARCDCNEVYGRANLFIGLFKLKGVLGGRDITVSASYRLAKPRVK